VITNATVRVDGIAGGPLGVDGEAVVQDDGVILATNAMIAAGYRGTGHMMVSNGQCSAPP